MKKYRKEIIILGAQVLCFYALPLVIPPEGVMAMVLMFVMVALTLGFAMGYLSDHKIKYLFPFVVAIVFIPTIYIYYNESAWIHTVWYLEVSAIGLLFGALINKLMSRN